MQAIYGTDKSKGRGIIAASGSVTTDFTETLSRWNTNVTNETRGFLRPIPGAEKSDAPERIYTIVSEQYMVYFMCTIYDNERDSKHRWNTETHGVAVDGKSLESPGNFLYMNTDQFDPLNASLTPNFDINSTKSVSDEQAMGLCGFLCEDGTVSQKYLSLMNSVYSILRESTSVAQTLFIKTDSWEKGLMCLQSIYAGMPDSLRSLVSSSNVPMTAVSIPILLPKYRDQMPNGGKFFDLETGENNVPKCNLNLYFFRKMLSMPKNSVRAVLRNVEEELHENWNGRTEEHYEFLSYYLIGKEMMSNPSQCRDQDIESIIMSLSSISDFSDEINNVLEVYIRYCFDRKYIIKTPQLYGVLNMKSRCLCSENNNKKSSLGMLIREYMAWLLMTTNPDQEIYLLFRDYEQHRSSQRLNDELDFIIKYMPDPADRTAFIDNLTAEKLACLFRNMADFHEIAAFCDLCSIVSKTCNINMMSMKKSSRLIKEACVSVFDKRTLSEPQALYKYMETNYAPELNRLRLPRSLYNEIVNNIRSEFWKRLCPEQWRCWLKKPGLEAVKNMIIPGDQKCKEIYYMLLDTYRAMSQLKCNDGYVHRIVSLFDTIPENISGLLAETLVYKSFEKNSEVRQICEYHDKKWISSFCIHLYSVLGSYYSYPKNIFDLTKENNLNVLEDLTDIAVEKFSEQSFRFFISQLDWKLDVCQDDERKSYHSIRSKAEASWNKFNKQKRKNEKDKWQKPKKSESNVTQENNLDKDLFKQGKKLFESLFKKKEQ